jgi:hypothetical protein
VVEPFRAAGIEDKFRAAAAEHGGDPFPAQAPCSSGRPKAWALPAFP